MLSQQEKDNLRSEWRNCPAGEKRSIMAEFIREYGDDPGWETWLMFLNERLPGQYCEESLA